MVKDKRGCRQLYGVVEWLNGHPILDGIPYFDNTVDATKYAMCHQTIGNNTGVDVKYTIIRLNKAITSELRS